MSSGEYSTHFNNGRPVDFISSEGPLRASENYGELDWTSRQDLGIPPEDAEIWQEVNQERQKVLGEVALNAAEDSAA